MKTMLKLDTITILLTLVLRTTNQSPVNDYLAPSVFINHGAGPKPLMGEKNNLIIGDSIRIIRDYIDFERLKAVILITAHWEGDKIMISSGKTHELYYDYFGYPQYAYEFKHPAAGHPEIAKQLYEALNAAGIEAELDEDRGWDHGTFVPMKLFDPNATIPVVQVSIYKEDDEIKHWNIGKVLYNFRKQGIAIFGSGNTYHDLEKFRKLPRNDTKVDNVLFDHYLNDVCLKYEKERKVGLLRWRKAPQSSICHPPGKGDHMMPLLVNAGAGGKGKGKSIFRQVVSKNIILNSFLWDTE